ncbi:MAG: YbjN domain-containing protein [Dehalococcoidia bacterium]
MAHAIIEHAQRELPQFGFEVQPIGGAGEPTQLLVKTVPDYAGRERWMLLTVYEDLGENLQDAWLVQFFHRFPVEAPAPEQRAELARLLIAANNKITIGQFCFREEDALLYYRAVVIFPSAPDAWTKLLSEHLFISVFQVDEFGAAIEAVATGAQTLQGAVAADPRLGPLG